MEQQRTNKNTLAQLSNWTIFFTNSENYVTQRTLKESLTIGLYIGAFSYSFVISNSAMKFVCLVVKLKKLCIRKMKGKLHNCQNAMLSLDHTPAGLVRSFAKSTTIEQCRFINRLEISCHLIPVRDHRSYKIAIKVPNVFHN